MIFCPSYGSDSFDLLWRFIMNSDLCKKKLRRQQANGCSAACGVDMYNLSVCKKVFTSYYIV